MLVSCSEPIVRSPLVFGLSNRSCYKFRWEARAAESISHWLVSIALLKESRILSIQEEIPNNQTKLNPI
jgi:hypothetical protein